MCCITYNIPSNRAVKCSLDYHKTLNRAHFERGRGQPVILIHGTLNDFRVWQFQIESFTQKFHVVSSAVLAELNLNYLHIFAYLLMLSIS